jgi:sugar phosphate isomerase/epimerase
MNRRTFIKASGIAGAATLLSKPMFSMIVKPKYKMGYQLFSIRDEMAKDPVATLKALKAMGYEDFEIYGFENEMGTFYGYKSLAFKQILDDLDLSVSSGHYGFSPYLEASDDDLKRFIDQCITGARTLGSKYITWPWIAPEQRTIDNYKLLSRKLNIAGEKIINAGLGFAYHNHGYEFESKNGESGYEIILNETDPFLVKLQLDMYWVMHSSEHTPSELIGKQPGRYVMWHIKDMDKNTKDYTELGNGSIDYAEILPNASESGLEFYYLEQGGNYAESPLKSAATRADYFLKHLHTSL